jgi:hypothetical protein
MYILSPNPTIRGSYVVEESFAALQLTSKVTTTITIAIAITISVTTTMGTLDVDLKAAQPTQTVQYTFM